jgi:hypothetical protein
LQQLQQQQQTHLALEDLFFHSSSCEKSIREATLLLPITPASRGSLCVIESSIESQLKQEGDMTVFAAWPFECQCVAHNPRARKKIKQLEAAETHCFSRYHEQQQGRKERGLLLTFIHSCNEWETRMLDTNLRRIQIYRVKRRFPGRTWIPIRVL